MADRREYMRAWRAATENISVSMTGIITIMVKERICF
jgi:hypothetical protein